jgi:hypothetical protein
VPVGDAALPARADVCAHGRARRAKHLFRRAAQKLEPLRAPLFEAIRGDFLVHADETSFKLTSQASKAFIWTFVGAKLTGYRFALTRGGDVPIEEFGDSERAVVCDDYRAYDPLVKKGHRRRCGCLAHARRKYFEAGDGPEAHEALELIAGIYRVEHEAERLGIVGTSAHRELRRTYARPLFARLVLLAREVRRAHGPRRCSGARRSTRGRTSVRSVDSSATRASASTTTPLNMP